MQNQRENIDFVLCPAQFTDNKKMLAVDSSKQRQTYIPHFTMETTLVDAFGFPVDSMCDYAQTHDPSTSLQPAYYDPSSMYSGAFAPLPKTANFPSMPVTPPSLPIAADHFIPGLCTASGPSIASASSSAIGSPHSGTAHLIQEEWIHTTNGLGLADAVMGGIFPREYFGGATDADGLYQKKWIESCVDPSVIQPNPQQCHLSPPTISFPEPSDYILQEGFFPQSPNPSHYQLEESYPTTQPFPQQRAEFSTASPFPTTPRSLPVAASQRRSSVASVRSRLSQPSPASSIHESDDETKEKGRCPHPDCGRVFKDLKAHMLTHQSERPEKCPIATCEYHIKGFARKYDKNRHTLTHYKGTMVCGFCPGSGSPAEKSFNRADVFKRHLTSVHGVEQTPPNCRKRTPVASTTKDAPSHGAEPTGKCSTCSITFSNAQDFYEHLDDCVLRVVQQEEPSEAINQKRLAEVEADEEVKKTMEKHMLLDTAGTVDRYSDENDDDDDDFYESPNQRLAKNFLRVPRGNPAAGARAILGSGNAVTKSSANKMRATAIKRRNNRDRYPQSWGCPSSSIKTKKRVLCVFDGQRRLWKDEMMLDNDFEVRLKLPGGAGDGTTREAYVTDLDVETLKRAEGVLNANDEERGPWLNGPSTHLIGRPAVLLPDVAHPHEGELDLDELMS
ncbi:putative C2H2 finger domain protein [Aspergillus homomorphus CBS 101889]|uniref:C2H2 finger domain protein n=1 Tax=Aspergillus homomorphus (strain CBS 101889) TaxID=1450537 RepID=A0A395I1F8_ASPHC|nr:C2H2 finger domain protein [Aspergillus homomorphus CBS 101889]RAL13565.1 C2H2 finger domain protein [Aspergillus homomorphus CBS 101889]